MPTPTTPTTKMGVTMKATNKPARTSTTTISTMTKGLQLLASNLSTGKVDTRKYGARSLSVPKLIKMQTQASASWP